MDNNEKVNFIKLIGEKQLRKRRVTSTFLITIFAVFYLFSGVSAANSISPSSDFKPLWNISNESELDMFLQAPYHVPNTNIVYLHTNTSVNSETKSWIVSVVSAVDKTTGKKKWSFEFYKKGCLIHGRLLTSHTVKAVLFMHW